MANISLLGANYNDVPAVTLPQTGGGVATFYEYDAKGKMPELLQTIYNAETALADTSFNGWTPSTTAKSIKATQTAGTFAANFAKYDYLGENYGEYNYLLSLLTLKNRSSNAFSRNVV